MPEMEFDENLDHVSSEDLATVGSWAIGDPHLEHDMKWMLWKTKFNISDVAYSHTPLGRTPLYVLKKALRRLTKLQAIRLPCCVNNCTAADIDRPTSTSCEVCNEPFYETVLSGSVTIIRPRKHFFYFSPLLRLRYLYAQADTSKDMQSYVERTQNERDHVDFWTSTLYRKLRAEGYFEDSRTLSITCGTDGVQLVRQGSFGVWPFLLTVNNLPPEVRYRSMMITLLIPGPNDAVDLKSFTKPLMKDLETLSLGIPAYDGHRKKHFTLKGHLCSMTGDTQAISKIMGMSGSNGKAPCRFCSIVGIRNDESKHYYYPLNERTIVEKPDHLTLDSEIGLRLNLRRDITLVLRGKDKDEMMNTGIKSKSWLLKTDTIVWPGSFGLDIMHLISNVAKMMWDLWNGEKLLPHRADGPDDYVLSKKTVMSIGIDLKKCAQTVPVAVSRTPRNIARHSNSFKAKEWFEWILTYSVPLLTGRLPDWALTSWSDFVTATRLAVQVRLSPQDIAQMEENFRRFVVFTEKHYYRNSDDRILVCTAQLHGLLHIACSIRILGPAYCSWQFGVERCVGTPAALTRSKYQQNDSLFDSLETREQLYYLEKLYRMPYEVRASTHQRQCSIAGTGTLLGPVKRRCLPVQTREIILSYYSSRVTNLGRQSPNPFCYEWTSFRRDVEAGTACNVTMSTSCSESQVAFSIRNSDGQISTEYGQILAFIEYPLSATDMCYLAQIQPFTVSQTVSTRRLYITGRQATTVLVDLADVLTSVGVIKNSCHQGRDTRVRRATTTGRDDVPEEWLAIDCRTGLL